MSIDEIVYLAGAQLPMPDLPLDRAVVEIWLKICDMSRKAAIVVSKKFDLRTVGSKKVAAGMLP